MDKILLIDKPKDWTSFDVVAKLRSAIRRKYQVAGSKQKIKVGHAGTLDPFATGLLIVLVGAATKKQDDFMKKDKEYEATLKLGFTSTTGDPEGEISPYQSKSHSEFTSESQEILKQVQDDEIKLDKMENALKKFSGENEQTPHVFSAIKIDGKRAYELARAGKEVEIKPRKVIIHSLKIKNYEFPYLKIEVSCSSGTYIRVLAEDIGKELGCGAYLTELRRTKIDNFDIKDALSVEDALKVLDKLEQ